MSLSCICSVDKNSIKGVEISIAGAIDRQMWLAQPRGRDSRMVKPAHVCAS